MKFIHGDAISEAIQACRPQRIAVAYLGGEWSRYLTSPELLEAIVISPKIGTNPGAVMQLVDRLERDGQSGWERVHFLDELHAKLYLGNEECVVGSANLTGNGLHGDRLMEAAVVTSDVSVLTSAGEFFEDILSRAMRRYPDEESKRQRWLQLVTEEAMSGSAIPPKQPRSILDLIDPLPEFHVCWYTTEGPEMTKEAVESVNVRIEHQLHIRPEDRIEVGQWVLTWQLTSKNRMHRGVRPSWMRVDHVRHDAVDLSDDPEYCYTTVALQAARSKAQWQDLLVTAPFDITPAVAAAMARVLEEDHEIREGLVQPNCDHAGQPWQLSKATAQVSAFVRAIQREMRKAE